MSPTWGGTPQLAVLGLGQRAKYWFLWFRSLRVKSRIKSALLLVSAALKISADANPANYREFTWNSVRAVAFVDAYR